MAPARKRNAGEVGYNFSWPLAFVLGVAIIVFGGGWIGLMAIHVLPPVQWADLKWVISHVVTFLVAAGLVPLGKFYRRKQLDFKISPSDPPSEGPDSGDDHGAT
jgi:hypothetical protein